MSEAMVSYWREAIQCALDEVGAIPLSDQQLRNVAAFLVIAHEQVGIIHEKIRNLLRQLVRSGMDESEIRGRLIVMMEAEGIKSDGIGEAVESDRHGDEPHGQRDVR